MNKWLIAGTGLALTLGGVAVAQTPPAPPPGPPPGVEMRHGPGMDGPGMEGRGRGGPHEFGRHGMRGQRPPMSKAAFFRFHKGDASVAVKCPDDEPVKACVDAAALLLDKLAQAK